MNLTRQSYRGEEDYRRITDFLRRVYLRNGRLDYSWQAARLDYWRWHINENLFQMKLSDAIFLWETSAGGLAGVLNLDHPGEFFLQVDPEFGTPELESEMIALAEQQHALAPPGERPELTIWSPEANALRQEILHGRGFTRQPWPEYQRRRQLSEPAANLPAPSGYTLRSLGGPEELPARSWASWKAFHPAEPDDRYEGWQWYLNVQRAPLYRGDLDLVAQAPNGEIAAFCTVWYDAETQTAMFEPVGTRPDHQRRGLGRCLMAEGLRRAQELGASLATVGAYSPAANALYASAGFTAYNLSYPWTKPPFEVAGDGSFDKT